MGMRRAQKIGVSLAGTIDVVDIVALGMADVLCAFDKAW
jgi:hypothetical protein